MLAQCTRRESGGRSTGDSDKSINRSQAHWHSRTCRTLDVWMTRPRFLTSLSWECPSIPRCRTDPALDSDPLASDRGAGDWVQSAGTRYLGETILMILSTTSSIAVTSVLLPLPSYANGQIVIRTSQVPVSPYDNALALNQMELAYLDLLGRSTVTQNPALRSLARDGADHPQIVRWFFPHRRFRLGLTESLWMV